MSSDARSFGVGLLIGVVVGLLFAPRPGKETRAILGKGLETLRERAFGAMEGAGERSLWAVERSADTVERTAEAVRVKSAGAALKIKADRLARDTKSS